MKKKIIATLIIMSVLLSSGIAYAAGLRIWKASDGSTISEVNYDIYVNGKKLDMYDPDTKKLQTVLGFNGRTYVPVRKIAEALGADSDAMWAKDPKTGKMFVNIITDKSDPTDYIQENDMSNKVFVKYALKTNAAIIQTAKDITAGMTSKEAKARAIYKYVIDNMTYDNAQAEGLLNGTWDVEKQGAIDAFNTKNGICYDYACLYATMADAVGLNVRLIIGEVYTQGENGEVVTNGHAWNEVQIGSEWKNVDATWGDTSEKDFITNFGFETADKADTNEKPDNTMLIVLKARYATKMLAEFENY